MEKKAENDLTLFHIAFPFIFLNELEDETQLAVIILLNILRQI